jgi:hypothetical protein
MYVLFLQWLFSVLFSVFPISWGILQFYFYLQMQLPPPHTHFLGVVFYFLFNSRSFCVSLCGFLLHGCSSFSEYTVVLFLLLRFSSVHSILCFYQALFFCFFSIFPYRTLFQLSSDPWLLTPSRVKYWGTGIWWVFKTSICFSDPVFWSILLLLENSRSVGLFVWCRKDLGSCWGWGWRRVCWEVAGKV